MEYIDCDDLYSSHAIGGRWFNRKRALHPLLGQVEGCRFHPGIGPCETCEGTGYMVIDMKPTQIGDKIMSRVACPFGCEGGKDD